MHRYEAFKDFPELHQILIDTHLLDLIPGGFSIATDVSCQAIIHNPVAAKFLRVEQWTNLSHSSIEPPSVKVYQDGRLLKAEKMPIQMAVCYGMEIFDCELKFVWEDGLARTSRWSARPLRDHNGQICGAIATMEDITDLVNLTQELNWHQIHLEELVEERTTALMQEFEKRQLAEQEAWRSATEKQLMEKALSLAEERFVKAFQYSSEIRAIIRETDSVYTDINEQFLNTFQLKRKDVIGKIPQKLGATHTENVEKMLSEIRRKGKLNDYEIVFPELNRVLLTSAIPITIHDEEHILFSANDITEQKKMRDDLKQANQQLAKSNQINTSILESIQDMFSVLDREWNYVYVNSSLERQTRKTKQELIGKNIWATFPQLVGTLFHSKLLQAVRENTVIIFEYICVFTGTWYESHVYPSPDGVTVLSHDITSRKEAGETKALLASIVENSEFGILYLNLDGTIVSWNHGQEKIHGYTQAEAVGKNIYHFVPPDKISEADWIMRELYANGSVQVETMRKHKDGRLINVLLTIFLIKDTHGIPIGISSISMDLTERKHMEKEMARLDRLNLIGELSAGISHEVRNPMTVVRGYLQLFTSRPQFSEFIDQLNIMIDELDRANEIITRFLSVGNNSETPSCKQNLNAIIESLLPLIEADALRQEKEVETKLGDIPDLVLNEKEIRQVVLNLARNGMEAMQARGKLTIKTYVKDQQVILAVQDQGPGIPAEVFEKIGAPFFSTKEGGSGLGLAVCYGIAIRHKATITIETGNLGTTFFVYFKTV